MGEREAIMKWSNITVGWGKCLRTEIIKWNGLTIKWGVYYDGTKRKLHGINSLKNGVCVNICKYDPRYRNNKLE
jgi:hypothetical protein